MSILTDKHILVVGEETGQISKVEAALITYGATITSSTCETVDLDNIIAQGVDLVLLNHFHDETHCRRLMEALQEDRLSELPVFVLVQNNEAHINEAFMLGAADYITPEEDPHDIIEKMKVIFGGTTGSETDATAIDITPKAADASEGIRVFAVEDDPLLRNLLAVRFEKSNLPFELAEDGENIVAKVQAFAPHIIILDLMLPGKDGFSVLEDLQQSDVSDIPVVVFSNKDTHNDRERAEQLGAVAFYVKAMTDLTELINVIERFAKR